MAEPATIRAEVEGPVATVTLNRPDRMNAMNPRMAVETYDALSRLAADDDVRVVVLTGEGRGFCPGADVEKSVVEEQGADEKPYQTWHFRVPVLLHEMPKVTVAAVNGACAGAGLGWALACDLRLAARSARFATAFLRVGVAGDMGVPWSLLRLVGGAKARELLFLPEKVDADEAARIGLVNRVFDDDTFRREVAAVVDRLARSAPLALRAMKEHVVAAERMSFADFVDMETGRHLRLATSEDVAEGFAAFAEGREPQFRGV